MAFSKVTATTNLGALDNIFAKVAHVYYKSSVINAAPTADITADFELPIIEDSVSFDTGSIDKTEVKLTTGQVWISKSTKGDSSISMQVASLNNGIASLFLTKNAETDETFTGFALDVKKATGSLIFTDETGKGIVILPNAEMYGSLVVGDGDNPAYFNVSVTPLANNANASIYISAKEAS